MTHDDSRLNRIAESVADGESVDWEMTDSQVLNRQLKVLEKVERIRQIQTGDAETPGFADGATAPIQSMTHWKHLELRGRLGSGAYGDVYRAYDPTLQREVALKLLDISRIGNAERCLEEARKQARVKHDNVVTIYGADREAGHVGIWMELIEGRTLEEIIQKDGPLSSQEAREAGLAIGRAIAAVHKAGLVHGDIKTANIMRERMGKVVLMDFSSSLERGGTDDPLTGTPLYIAPELLTGGEPSRQSDIYSWGVTLYRLLTAEYPVTGRNLDEIRFAHQTGSSTSIVDVRPDVDADLARVVELALHREPGRRYQGMGDIERALLIRGSSSVMRNTLLLAATLAVISVLFLTLGPATRGAAFEAEAALFRASTEGDLRLRSGARIQTGDQLYLELQGNEEMYVYVVNEDHIGEVFLLFPVPSLDHQNPLESNSRHVLPGAIAGQEHYWEVTSGGGAESLLIVASAVPLPEIQSILDAARQGAAGEVPVVDSRVVPTLRGIGGLKPAPREPREGALTGEIRINVSERDDVRIWELQLYNPQEP